MKEEKATILFLILLFAIGGFFIILLNLFLATTSAEQELFDYEQIALNEVKESVLYKHYSDKEVTLKGVERQNSNKWTYTYEFKNVNETLENVDKFLYIITIEEGFVVHTGVIDVVNQT